MKVANIIKHNVCIIWATEWPNINPIRQTLKRKAQLSSILKIASLKPKIWPRMTIRRRNTKKMQNAKKKTCQKRHQKIAPKFVQKHTDISKQKKEIWKKMQNARKQAKRGTRNCTKNWAKKGSKYEPIIGPEWWPIRKRFMPKQAPKIV